MYCVKCGVKLPGGVEKCPLCATPVWNPNAEAEREELYPDRYPQKEKNRRHAWAMAATILLILSVITVLLICNRIYGKLEWGGLVVFGSMLAYISLFLPLWFSKPNPVIFIPVTHVAAGAYLAYICTYAHGTWFWGFAFPVIAMSMIITSAFTALMKYVKGARYFIFGGLFFLIGGASILTEFFGHMTFGTPMFVWSLFSCGACFVVGMILTLAGIIRPMGDYFNRLFFF